MREIIFDELRRVNKCDGWVRSEVHLVEVDRAEDLLVRVDPAGQRCVVADQLQRRDGLQGGEHTGARVQFDQEVDLDGVDVGRDVIKGREHDGGGAALLHLEDVGEDLTEVLVLQHDEDDWRGALVVDHGERAVSELARGVGSSVDAGDLHELLGHVVGGEEACALAEAEQVLLVLKYLCNLLIRLQVFIRESHVDALRKQFNITDKSLTSLFHHLVQHCSFLIGEPNSN